MEGGDGGVAEGGGGVYVSGIFLEEGGGPGEHALVNLGGGWGGGRWGEEGKRRVSNKENRSRGEGSKTPLRLCFFWDVYFISPGRRGRP